jgi:hypothetical protein
MGVAELTICVRFVCARENVSRFCAHTIRTIALQLFQDHDLSAMVGAVLDDAVQEGADGVIPVR